MRVHYFLPLLLLLPLTTKAVTAPPSLTELCESSGLVMLATYQGGKVSRVKDCQFTVTYEVKPSRIFKQPGNIALQTTIRYRESFYLDTPNCQQLPGPNATPRYMKSFLRTPPTDAKLFFLAINPGEKHWSLSNPFWAVHEGPRFDNPCPSS